MPAKPHEPSDLLRKQVESYSSIGIPQEDVARLIGITKTTLRKYYRAELDLATLKANASVAGALYKKAMAGDTTSQIFWLKTRAKWRETEQPKPMGDAAHLLRELAKALPG